MAWPDVLHGRTLHGHDEVRAYRADQLAVADPQVTPTGFDEEGDATVVHVHQVIRGLEGNVLREADLDHVYRFDPAGKVASMQVRGGG